jgi:hypothetical protein
MRTLRISLVVAVVVLAVVALLDASRSPNIGLRFYKCRLVGVDSLCLNQPGGIVEYHEINKDGMSGAVVKRLTAAQAKSLWW